MSDTQTLIAAMRRCADGECDDRCPYAKVEHDCSAVMLRDAAELLDKEAE